MAVPSNDERQRSVAARRRRPAKKRFENDVVSAMTEVNRDIEDLASNLESLIAAAKVWLALCQFVSTGH